MRIVVILNPKSRKAGRRSLQATLEARFGRSLVSVERTAYPRHATDIVRRAVQANVDTIVAVGGDGTVNEVLNGMVGTDVALGIIPAGSANDLASLHHLPSNVAEACDVILQRRTHRVDLIRVNGWHYVTAGGVGFPCDVARIATTIRRSGAIGRRLGRAMGSVLYVLGVLCALVENDTGHNRMTIRSNGHSVEAEPLWLMVDNQSFVGKRFLMSPGAVNDDGLFDICLADDCRGRARVLWRVLQLLSGKHIHSPSVSTWRADEIAVEAERPLAYFGDGEIHQVASAFEIQICPSALNLIVPAALVDGERITSTRMEGWEA